MVDSHMILLTVLDVDNREWGLPDVKSKLDPTPIGVGSSTRNMASFHTDDLKYVPWVQ